MQKFLLTALFLAFLPLLPGCDKPAEKEQKVAEKVQKAVTKKEEKADDVRQDQVDEWTGKWVGVNKSTLIIDKSGDGYGITIKTDKGEERYLGVRDNLRIRFTRGDHEEYLAIQPGKDSGVEELKNKRYCLIPHDGEAYCRDKI